MTGDLGLALPLLHAQSELGLQCVRHLCSRQNAHTIPDDVDQTGAQSYRFLDRVTRCDLLCGHCKANKRAKD